MIALDHTLPAANSGNAATWKKIVFEYQKPNFWRASWQIVNTIGSGWATYGMIRASRPWKRRGSPGSDCL